MNLSETEELVFAYFVANGAQEFAMVGRFFPYGELVLVLEDKIRVATRKFGAKAGRAPSSVARAFLDLLIEQGAFSTVKNKFGGAMHQYQPDAYVKCLKDLRETNPIVVKAQAAGPGFWDEAFAAAG
jgi:hypothetical protein